MLFCVCVCAFFFFSSKIPLQFHGRKVNLFGEWEVAVDVQLELWLGQLLLDGNTAYWADLALGEDLS